MSRSSPPSATTDVSRAGAGRWAALLLFPHIALGTYLVIVPDNVAFLATQIVTLIHVWVALACLPFVAWLILRHARRAPSSRRTVRQKVNWLLAGTCVLVVVTGGAAFFAYSPVPAKFHAVFGVALGAPLGLHLLLSSRRITGVLTFVFCGLCAASAGWARVSIPPDTVDPKTPAFSYRVRPASEYESSEWCARCHPHEYETWSRSTHAHAFEVKTVADEYLADATERGHRLSDVAKYGDAAFHGTEPMEPRRALAACAKCHGPTAYYGDAEDLPGGKPMKEGIGCAFCHTIRGVVNPDHEVATVIDLMRGTVDFDPRGVFARTPNFISAPETVRRYVFQNSDRLPMRWLGDLLIRWRPSMHKHDYDSPAGSADTSCRVCHDFAMNRDEVAAFQHAVEPTLAGQPRRQRTTQPSQQSCWSCHMPEQSHLFPGGNVAAQQEFGNGAEAKEEHAFAGGDITVRVEKIQTAGDKLDAEVVVQNDLPHSLPTFQGEFRIVWVHIYATDASGRVVADSTVDGILDNALLIPLEDRMAPGEERRFPVSLPIKGGVPRQIVAELSHNVDPAPFVHVSQAVGP